jgi:hypothetical protein
MAFGRKGVKKALLGRSPNRIERKLDGWRPLDRLIPSLQIGTPAGCFAGRTR